MWVVNLMLTPLALLILRAASSSGNAGQPAPSTSEPRLLHAPSIFGDKVVFTYAADLWVTTLQPGAIARRLTSTVGGASYAHISPDGKSIAFTATYDGGPNVYVMPIEGGEPKRLTFDSVPDVVLGWKPDGKIAYASTAGSSSARNSRLWFVDPKGGLPIWTPIEQAAQVSFLPDGQTVAYQRVGSNSFNWRRYRGGSQGRISLYNLVSNTYSELPSKREQSYYPMAVGRSIYYISDRTLGTLNLYRYDLDKAQDTQLTRFTDSDIKRPSTDGKSIVFERDGYLERYDIASGTVNRLAPKIISDNVRARPELRKLASDITNLSLSPSGVRVAIEARGRIFSVPAENGETRNLTGAGAGVESHPAWSPDGKLIAFISDVTGEEELYTRPVKGGEATRLTTNAPTDLDGILWSPDSKTIALGDRSGAISFVDVATKSIRTIQTLNEDTFNVSFSPNSKWAALVIVGKNQIGAVWIVEVATGQLHQVTSGFYNDSAAVFDQAGKYLYLLSDRTFDQSPDMEGAISLVPKNATRAYVIPLTKDLTNPLLKADQEEPGTEPAQPSPSPSDKKPDATKPLPGSAVAKADAAKTEAQKSEIDFDGIGDRMLPLPWPAGAYTALLPAKNGVFVLGPEGLLKFDMNSLESETIVAGPVRQFALNQDSSKLAYVAGGRLAVAPVHPGITFSPGSGDLSGVEAVVDPKAEWRQIFWQAWRWVRDNYYDPKLRGLDWNAIGKRYAAYLEYANHRNDLNEIIGLMIGELGTGHSYVGGGDPGPRAVPIPVGLLGADYEASEGKVRFKKIYRGFNFDEHMRAPLGDPGVNVADGEYLLAIDGTPLDASTSPSSLLIDKVGKTVTLTVNTKPSMDGARTVRVRPIGDEETLRYADWVETRRQLVSKLSGGRIGYLHIPDTSEGGAEGFVRGFYGQTDKDAWVIDERNNSGGNLPWFFVEKLARKPLARGYPRRGVEGPDEPALDGPKVMLINELAGSGGDMLPYLFRKAGLGPLVGKRTWGGLIGIAGFHPLLDGGFVTAPEYALFDPTTDEIIAENQGIDPDVDIDNRPDLVAQGRDPQVEKAVSILLDELKKLPPKKLQHDLPHVGRNGVVGR